MGFARPSSSMGSMSFGTIDENKFMGANILSILDIYQSGYSYSAITFDKNIQGVNIVNVTVGQTTLNLSNDQTQDGFYWGNINNYPGFGFSKNKTYTVEIQIP